MNLKSKKLLGIWNSIEPFRTEHKLILNFIEENKKYLKGIVVDAGCGYNPYRKYVEGTYIGIDITGNPQIISDLENVPLKKSFADSVICTQVLEHVKEPDKVIKEIHRVMKKNGHLLITVPFLSSEHDIPHDYFRYTKNGIAYMLEKNNFEIIEVKKNGTFSTVLVTYLNSRLYKKWRKHIFLLSPFIILWNFLGLFSRISRNQEFYLFTSIVAKKK